MSRYSVAPRRGDSRQSVFGTLTQSSASAASTQYDSDGAVILTPAQQRIKERQAELDLFTKLEKQVEQFQAHLDGIAADMGTLAGGGETFATVVENWKNVFRATHLAMASMAAKAAKDGQVVPTVPVLVRIPTSATGLSEAP
ncbi:ubiquitin C-terminal hydrolase Ubp14 [Cystobasidiomycetes sp. EMM_F5]